MTNITPLQQTIWNLAMTGGSVMFEENIVKVTPTNLWYLLEKSDGKTKDGKNLVLPIIHSFSKLTEPVLDGKVPIVELGKIAFNGRYNVIDATNGIDGVYCKILTKNHRITEMYFSTETMSFYKVVDGTIKGYIPNQKKLFGFLKSEHFNIENLPEGTFIEKSTLKLK